MKKIVVYTALFGAYDSQLINVEYDREKFDFVCFTNMKRLKSDTWDIKYVDQYVKGDNPRSAYYYKTNPHLIWKNDYDLSIWIDSSCNKLNTDKLYAMAEKVIKSDKALFIEQHPSRNCTYEELKANCALNKDSVGAMIEHIETYRREGLPKDNGMVETGFQIRKHNDPDVIRFQKLLWHEITTKTRRDQLSWNYCQWKLKFDKYELFTFQDKTEILWFQDHPHRTHHVDKVLLAGPWFGDEYFEPNWAKYVQTVTENEPFDKIVVGCRSGREYLYKSFTDQISSSNPEGVIKFNLLNNKVPNFAVKTSDDKEIKKIIPSIDICNKLKEDVIKKHKVFVIGMFKTGTTSLGKALEILGYNTLHGPWWITPNHVSDSFNENVDWKAHEEKIKQMVEQYDAFQDFPWMYLYKELYNWYPDAKFIYMNRDANSLAESEYKMWDRSGSTADEIPPAQKFIDRYENHKKDVHKFFKGKDNFLEMSIIDGKDGWDSLCKFLTMPLPIDKFPHSNKATNSGGPSKHKFKVIIPGGPAEKYIDKCIKSVTSQKGVDVQVQVMLDDCGDKTFEIANKLKSHNVNVHINTSDHKNYPVGNIVEGIRLLEVSDDDIIVTVDADDWLAHDMVLKRVQQEYDADDNVLITHGSWQDYPDTGILPNNSIPYTKVEFDRGIRRGMFHASHLRTFKYKCFKYIPDHYFKNDAGHYYDSAGDVALMYALLESAGFEGVKFIPEVLYIYNRETEFNEDKVKSSTQYSNLKEIVTKPIYIPPVKDDVLKISLVDKTFPHGKTVMNYDFKTFDSPIEWDRENLDHDIICFTDFTLQEVDNYNNDIKIALLIEPPSIFSKIYDDIQHINNKFDYVFTFDQRLLDQGKNYVDYSYGGCWVEPKYQSIYSKTKQVSIIASTQNRTDGHKLRHEVISKYGSLIEGIYGKAYNPLKLKIDGLKDFKYQIVIENNRMLNYFSEKLIDCFVTGTIPIYWGCSNLSDYGFDMNGVITFNNIEELKNILTNGVNDYEDKMVAIRYNFDMARKYMVTENSIYQSLQELKKDKIVLYHKRGHLGDCVHTMHYIKQLCVQNPNKKVDFYIKPEYLDEISLLIEDDMKHLIQLLDVNQYADGTGVNAWYGELGSDLTRLINSMPHDEFFMMWFGKVSNKLGIENPFKVPTDFLMDNKNILKKNCMSKKYDFLIVNSDTLSGQVNRDDKTFGEMIDYLAGKYTIITTKKYKDYPCTLDNNLSLVDIANISLTCDRIISVATSPFILCLNKWTIKTCKEFVLICDLFDFKYDLGSKEKFITTRSIKECKTFVDENY